MMDRFRSLFKPSPTPEQKSAVSGDTAWSESPLYGGSSVAKYNPDELIGLKGSRIYKKMMQDEQVKAVVKFKRDAITSRDYYFELKDDRVSPTEAEKRVAIYDEMLNQVAGSFNDGLNYIMKAAWQGFSITEKIIDTFEYDNTPYLGLKRLSPKPFDSFEIFTDEYGKILKVEQSMDGGRKKINLDKFVYYVQNPDMDEHYGQSELREAYRSWYAKDVIVRYYNIFIERMAGGLVVLKPDEGKTVITGSEEYNALKAILNSLQTTTGILLPSGISLEVHSPQSTDQFERAITLHDLQIAKALLVPNLLGITHAGSTGAYAQSQTQLEAFLWTLDSDALRLEDAVNEQIFDPLSKLNFADAIGPRFRLKPISEEMKLRIISAWKDLVSAKAVEATDADEDHLRELLNFPEKGEPIKEPQPIPPMLQPPGSSAPNPDPNNPVGNTDDEGLSDKTNGDPKAKKEKKKEELRRREIFALAFSRAQRRVAFAVIDRKTNDLVEQSSIEVSETLAELVAGVSLQVIDEKLGTPAGKMQPHEVKFDTRLKTKTRKAVDKVMKDAWDIGQKHAEDEMTKARKEPFTVKMARVDHVTDFLSNNAFKLTGDLTDSMLKTIRAILTNAYKYAWEPKEIVRKIYDKLTTEGFLFIETNAASTGRSISEVTEAIGGRKPVHRVKTAIRTSTFDVLNESRYATFADPELSDFIEALEYSAILDDRTTEICNHLDGRVYPVNSDEWSAYRPPNHFNCRSILIPVTVVDTDVTGKDKAKGSRWSKPPRVEPQSGFGGDTG